MTHASKRITAVMALGCVLALGACAQTQYVEGASEPENHLARTVRFDLRDAYFRIAPDCVAVLPARVPAGTAPETGRMIERTVARHLSQRINRVIGPVPRERWSRRLAVDLSEPRDRDAFLRGAGCDAFVEPALMAADDTYLVVWSSRSVDLRLRMFHSIETAEGDQDQTLWIARHAASRGDGGLPISPLSLGLAALEAGNHQSDGDMHPSLIEDAVRRMIVTLPDIRGPLSDDTRMLGAQAARQ